MDLQIFNFIHQFAGQNKIFDLIGSFFAGQLAYILPFVVVILFFKQKGWKNRAYFFSFTALSVILSKGIITETIKFFYHKPRPFAELSFEPLVNNSSYAFPSGHMSFFFALFLIVFYFSKNRNLAWWFLGLTVLMGLARIYAGVHWPIDILGGALVGLLSAWVIKLILPEPEEKIANESHT